jgi:hypothetical protein
MLPSFDVFDQRDDILFVCAHHKEKAWASTTVSLNLLHQRLQLARATSRNTCANPSETQRLAKAPPVASPAPIVSLPAG